MSIGVEGVFSGGKRDITWRSIYNDSSQPLFQRLRDSWLTHTYDECSQRPCGVPLVFAVLSRENDRCLGQSTVEMVFWTGVTLFSAELDGGRWEPMVWPPSRAGIASEIAQHCWRDKFADKDSNARRSVVVRTQPLYLNMTVRTSRDKRVLPEMHTRALFQVGADIYLSI